MFFSRSQSKSRDKISQTTQSKLAVVLEREGGKYYAGDTVTGYVDLELPDELWVKDIKLKIFGSAKLSWDVQKTYTKGTSSVISIRDSEVFINRTISLLKDNDADDDYSPYWEEEEDEIEPPDQSALCIPITLEKDVKLVRIVEGYNKYPFNVELPNHLPSSCDGKWGQIQYSIKVVIQRGKWKQDLEKVIDIEVHDLVDFNEDPQIFKSIAGHESFDILVMCCCMARVSVDVNVNRKGFVPGESIQFSVDLSCSTSMREAKICFMQHIVFKAKKETKRTSRIVNAISQGRIKAKEKKRWENESFVVPSDLIPTCIDNSRVIQIKYTLSVIITPWNKFTEEIIIPISIKIGNIPLRRSTIKQYIERTSLASRESTASLCNDKLNDLKLSHATIAQNDISCKKTSNEKHSTNNNKDASPFMRKNRNSFDELTVINETT